MDYIIYVLSGISIFLALGGFGYVGPKKNWVVITSIISIVFSMAAIIYVSFWPIVVGFAINWGFKLLGFEPTDAEVQAGLEQDENQNT